MKYYNFIKVKVGEYMGTLSSNSRLNTKMNLKNDSLVLTRCYREFEIEKNPGVPELSNLINSADLLKDTDCSLQGRINHFNSSLR